MGIQRAGADPARPIPTDPPGTTDPTLQVSRVLLVLLAGVAATNLPNTVLGASLDTIRADLDSGLTAISWVLIAPTLIFAVTAPLFGKLSDNFGGRRVYIGGLALGLAGSVLTAMAWNVTTLVAFRVIGQMGAAATGPAAFTIMAGRFQGRDRTRAIGLYSAVSAVSPMLGIGLGGPLIEFIGWRALFVVQSVPCAVGVVLAVLLLPDTPGRPSRRFDLAGGLLLGSGVAALLFALNRFRSWGVTHPVVVGCLVAGPVLLAAFTAVERRREHPLLPLRYLRRRRFSASISTLLLGNLTYMGGYIVTPLLLQRRYGYGVAATSYVVMIRPLCYAAGAWMSQTLRYRWGVWRLQVGAATVQVVAAVLMFASTSGHALALFLVAIACSGGGGGAAQTTLVTTITETVDEEDSGIASATASMVTSLGTAIGATLLSAIVADATEQAPFSAAFATAGAFSLVTVGTALLLRAPGSPPAPGAPAAGSEGGAAAHHDGARDR